MHCGCRLDALVVASPRTVPLFLGDIVNPALVPDGRIDLLRPEDQLDRSDIGRSAPPGAANLRSIDRRRLSQASLLRSCSQILITW